MGAGQVSVEHLVLVGLALALIIPAVYLFYAYNQNSQSASESEQINAIGLDIVSSVRSTYALGKNARQTLEVALPDSVTSISVLQDQELVISYDTQDGRTTAVFYSEINMSTPLPGGNLSLVPNGLKRYQFISNGENVTITEAS